MLFYSSDPILTNIIASTMFVNAECSLKFNKEKFAKFGEKQLHGGVKMSERKITAQAVQELISFYQGLPAATFFKGLTGYGFQVVNKVESVGELGSSSGIIHPSYIFMVGGEASGKKTLTAEDVKKAVEYFQANPLAADLRVTTGKGFKVVNGMAEFVDIQNCQSQTIFELTHYGGRSIQPMLVQELGRVYDPNIKWQSGFEYKDAQAGKNLVLIRHLIEEEWESQAAFDKVLLDLRKEVNRLMLFHCEDKLRNNVEKQEERTRIFLMQELNRYLDGSGQIRVPAGYQHEVRNDGVVMVRKSFRNVPADEAGFQAAIDDFNKACFGAYNLYCQPLGDNPPTGKPQGEVFGLVKVEEVSFERDSRRSTQSQEALIGWSSRTPVFPQDGWTPEKGNAYRVILHRWGKGYRATPAPPKYEKWASQEDSQILPGLLRVEFDGQQKFIPGEKREAKTWEDFHEGMWWFERLEFPDNKCIIVQKKIDRNYHRREVVEDGKLSFNDIAVDKSPSERSFVAERVFLDFSEDILKSVPWSDATRIKIKALAKDGDKEIAGSLEITGQDAWAQTPQLVKDQYENDWPVCSCGRERYEAAKHTQCNKCRNYRDCPRCDKLEQYFGEKRIAEGATCCSECSIWYEKQEEWVHAHLTAADFERIRAEAKEELRCSTTDQNGNLIINDEIYSSNFNKEELEFLANLPDSGNDLAKGIWWVCQGRSGGMSTGFKEADVLKLKERLQSNQKLLGKYKGVSDALQKAVDELRAKVEPFFYDSGSMKSPNPFSAQEKGEVQGIWQVGRLGSREELLALRTLEPIIERIKNYRQELEGSRTMYEEAIRQYYSRCPLCGRELVNDECPEPYANEHKPDLIKYPVDEDGEVSDDAVLSRLITDEGEIVAELRFLSGTRRRDTSGAIRIVRLFGLLDSEMKPFKSLIYQDLKAVLTEGEARARDKERARQHHQKEYEDQVSYLKESNAFILGPFQFGEHQGNPNASCRKGNTAFVVNHWDLNVVEKGKIYWCNLTNDFSANLKFVSPIMEVEDSLPVDDIETGEEGSGLDENYPTLQDLKNLGKGGEMKLGLK